MAELNGRVLAFTLLVSLVAPVMFGLFPALRASSVGLSTTLRDSRSGHGGRSGKRVRGALVTAQVSLALTLMIVASLLTRTVVNMSARPLGYDPADILTVRIDLPESGYEGPEAVPQFFREAQERVASLRGFEVVELTNALPGVGFGPQRSVEIEGLEGAEGRAAASVRFTAVSVGLFEALGLPLHSGRPFTESDDAESFPVAIVSREVASRFFAEDDPVGRRMRVVGSDEWIEVVGVAADVPSSSDPERLSLNVYVPFSQEAQRGMYLVGRTTTDPASAAGAVREAIWSVDAELPVGPIRTLERAAYENEASSYAVVTLFVTFALFALVMAAVGIYGVMAYSVSRRRREIGVRMALGARESSVRWMVIGQGGRMLVLGVAVGLVVSLGVTRLLGSVVFGVSTTDPLTFVGVPLLLGLVALVANLVPALRATRADPATTLRDG